MMKFILTKTDGKSTPASKAQIPELKEKFVALGKALGRPVKRTVVERVNNSLWLSINENTGISGKLVMIESKKEAAYCAMGSLLNLEPATRTAIEGAVRKIGKSLPPAWSKITADL